MEQEGGRKRLRDLTGASSGDIDALAAAQQQALPPQRADEDAADADAPADVDIVGNGWAPEPGSRPVGA